MKLFRSLETRRHGEHPRGVALLSALLSVALLTLIVLEMTDTTLVSSHLTRNAGNTIAAQLLARSAVVAAEGVLLQMRQVPEYKGKTALGQGWDLPFPDVPVADGAAAFAIEDEQGKLDLNQVGDPPQRAAIEALFAELSLEPSLVEKIAVWIDPNGAVSAQAADLCALTIPCEPPGGALRSLDELALIEGFEPAIIERLRPFTTAYSGAKGKSGVNLNTARAEVLRALNCEVGSNHPPQGGYETTDEVECDLPEKQRLLRLDSDVFSIQARGIVGDTTETVYAVIDRKGGRTKRLSWRERPVFAVSPIGLP